jgi:hypothetical protein
MHEAIHRRRLLLRDIPIAHILDDEVATPSTWVTVPAAVTGVDADEVTLVQRHSRHRGVALGAAVRSLHLDVVG